MKKICMLKPVTWNGSGYKQADGSSNSKGQSAEYGYGHEEWMNDPSMKHEGRAYFSMYIKSFERRNICALLIALHEGQRYLVGVVAGVDPVDLEEKEKVAKKLKIQEKWKDAWSVPKIQEIWEADMEGFKEHWNEHGHNLCKYSCPERLFYWFEDPISFNEIDAFEKKITHRQSGWEGISVDKTIEFLTGKLPANNPIFQWLKEGEFEDPNLKKKS